eukprot:GFKZ01010206.1.p1 GENE.GFKZ01010206.1~~GFKZ01010206.1.p1  ORF type:complete len:466 (-),score=79.82 GFKZ01010206.1:1164-2561(-)
MSASPLPSPPSCSTPLRVAIVGRPSAGKSTLLSRIVSAWPSAQSQTRTPPRPPAPRRPSSRLGVLLSRVIRFTRSVIAFRKGSGSCNVVPFQNGIAYDAHGSYGMQIVKNQCAGIPDIVLLVIRLDECRVTRQERLVLAEMVSCWGCDVLERTIVVMTHGGATPVGGLSYTDFVRGRIDLMKKWVEEVVPPKEVGGEWEGLVRNTIKGGIWGEDMAREEEESDLGDGWAGDEQLTEDCSVAVIGQNAIEDLYKELVHEKDRRVFAEREVAGWVVVEMGDAERKDEWGRGVMPDGKVWMEELLKEVVRVGDKVRRDPALVPADSVETRKGFWGTLGDMFQSLAKDWVRVLLAEAVIIVLGLNVRNALVAARRRRREKAMAESSGEDVLLEMSDEEFEKLDKSETGRLIIRLGGGPKDGKGKAESEEEVRASEEELSRAIQGEVDRRRAEGLGNPTMEEIKKQLNGQ